MSAEFSRALLKVSVAQIAQSLGWHAVQGTPMELLTDILERYMLQLGNYTHRYAEQFGRTDPNLDDLGLAFQEMGISLAELTDYSKNMDPVPFPLDVPQFPVKRENVLQIPKPGSRELLEREDDIEEHLPPLHPEWDEGASPMNPSPPAGAMTSPAGLPPPTGDTQMEISPPKSLTTPSGDKRQLPPPVEGTPPSSKRARILPDEATPSRYEMKSFILSSSGFLTPSGSHGVVADARTPPPPTPQTPTAPSLPTPLVPSVAHGADAPTPGSLLPPASPEGADVRASVVSETVATKTVIGEKSGLKDIDQGAGDGFKSPRTPISGKGTPKNPRPGISSKHVGSGSKAKSKAKMLKTVDKIKKKSPKPDSGVKSGSKSPKSSRSGSPARSKSPAKRIKSPGRQKSPVRLKSPGKSRSPSKAKSPGRSVSPARSRSPKSSSGKSPSRGKSPKPGSNRLKELLISGALDDKAKASRQAAAQAAASDMEEEPARLSSPEPVILSPPPLGVQDAVLSPKSPPLLITKAMLKQPNIPPSLSMMSSPGGRRSDSASPGEHKARPRLRKTPEKKETRLASYDDTINSVIKHSSDDIFQDAVRIEDAEEDLPQELPQEVAIEDEPVSVPEVIQDDVQREESPWRGKSGSMEWDMGFDEDEAPPMGSGDTAKTLHKLDQKEPNIRRSIDSVLANLAKMDDREAELPFGAASPPPPTTPLPPPRPLPPKDIYAFDDEEPALAGSLPLPASSPPFTPPAHGTHPQHVRDRSEKAKKKNKTPKDKPPKDKPFKDKPLKDKTPKDKPPKDKSVKDRSSSKKHKDKRKSDKLKVKIPVSDTGDDSEVARDQPPSQQSGPKSPEWPKVTIPTITPEHLKRFDYPSPSNSITRSDVSPTKSPTKVTPGISLGGDGDGDHPPLPTLKLHMSDKKKAKLTFKSTGSEDPKKEKKKKKNKDKDKDRDKKDKKEKNRDKEKKKNKKDKDRKKEDKPKVELSTTPALPKLTFKFGGISTKTPTFSMTSQGEDAAAPPSESKDIKLVIKPVTHQATPTGPPRKKAKGATPRLPSPPPPTRQQSPPRLEFSLFPERFHSPPRFPSASPLQGRIASPVNSDDSRSPPPPTLSPSPSPPRGRRPGRVPLEPPPSPLFYDAPPSRPSLPAAKEAPVTHPRKFTPSPSPSPSPSPPPPPTSPPRPRTPSPSPSPPPSRSPALSASPTRSTPGPSGGSPKKKGPCRIIAETEGTITDSDGQIIWICPACKMKDDGSPMIACDVCDKWYHWACMGITQEPPENELWFCGCRASRVREEKRAARGGASGGGGRGPGRGRKRGGRGRRP